MKQITGLLLVFVCLSLVSNLQAQQELLRLKVGMAKLDDWYYGTPGGPPMDEGTFKIPAAGVARYTYAGKPMVDQQQLAALMTNHWIVNQQKIPGGDVEPWQRVETPGEFRYVWLKEYKEEDVGKEVNVRLGVRESSKGLASASYPAQGSIFVVEWFGKNPVTPNTIGPPEITSADVSGTWKDKQRGDSWSFTKQADGSYQVKGTAFKGVNGKATLSNGVLKIEFTNSTGIRGTFDVKLDPSGNRGKGSVRTDQPSEYLSEIGLENGPTNPPSAGSFTVKLGNHQVKPGQTVNVPVELLEAAGVSNLNVVIEYSAGVARVNTTPGVGNAKTDHLFQANSNNPGVIRLGLAGKSGVNPNSQLAVIPFTATGQPGAKTELKVTVTTANNAEGNPLTAKTLAGSLEIVAADPPPAPPAPPVVRTPKDALDALMMSVQLRPEDLKLDLDKDGKVTSNDARLILREVVTR